MNQPEYQNREPPRFHSTKSNDLDVVNYLNSLFSEAAKIQASDIHIEDEEFGCKVRVRISGELRETNNGNNLPQDFAREVQEKIRARCKMSLIDVREPHDGRMRLRFDFGAVDVRVSVVPTLFGQSIVCRLLDQRNASRRIADIEMPPAVAELIQRIIKEPHGMLLVTGPTGSGKTSTLYAVINELKHVGLKIMTIEDPVEYVVPGLTQIPVEGRVTFVQALRAVLRQDPDIILIGEIRDSETAMIATRAALTGHLVLSTLHANDAPSSVTRMIDLGVDPFTLGTALVGVLAQRLVARLPDGAPKAPASPAQREWLRLQGVDVDPDARFGIPDHDTHPTTGRIPIMELLTVTSSMRNVILKSNAAQIKIEATRQPQYQTLIQAGVDLARSGRTTLDEVRRISNNIDSSELTSRIGQRLLMLGLIDETQLALGLRQQNAEGHTRQLGDVLDQMGYIPREEIDAAITA